MLKSKIKMRTPKLGATKKLKSSSVAKKELEELWKQIIKVRAGFKSELSGISGKQIGGSESITAHHIVGKGTDRLRFLEFDNGICLVNGSEHIFGVHHKWNPARAKEVSDQIIAYIGQERYDRLLSMRKQCGKKTDLQAAKIFLKQTLDELLKLKVDQE